MTNSYVIEPSKLIRDGWFPCSEDDKGDVCFIVYTSPACDPTSELVEYFQTRAEAQAWINQQASETPS